MATGKHATDGDLVAWDDGSIDEARQSWLASHFDDCPACRNRLKALQDVERVLQDQYPLVDDSAAQNAIIDRLRAERDNGKIQ